MNFFDSIFKRYNYLKMKFSLEISPKTDLSTVPKVSDARKSAGYALIFIALLYTTAPAVSAFARVNFIESVQEVEYENAPGWFKNWEQIGLIAWTDKNDDGKINYSSGTALKGAKPNYSDKMGSYGQRLVTNENDLSNPNEVYIDRDLSLIHISEPTRPY